MIGKKINQLATELAPASTDLTIIGNPTTGVSKKITLAQLGAIFSGAVSFYTNYAAFPTPGTTDVIYCAKDTKKLYLWSGSAYVEVFPSQALLDTYQLRSEKGNANGYASLDSSGKVPISQLPSSIMEYKGTWSAATNTPTLANGTGDTGDVYLCNAAGTVNFGAGPLTFAVGDYVVYSGSIWQRSSGAVGTVTSVAASITGNSIGITGSPITTSGTLALAFAGTSAQYVNGAGNLITFPSIISQASNLISEVYNSTGATLTKGTIVYINGGQGNLPTVTKAIATSDATSAQTYGVVQADITNMNNGYVVVAGRLIDLDTQAYSNGTQLYLSGTTAGTWTSTKPYAPTHLVYVGIVVRAHPTQGVVEVKIQNGYELDEIHNVSAQTPTNNDGLFYESSTSLWKNKSISTILGGTPVIGSGTTNFVSKFTASSTIGNSQIWDNGTSVLIGTTGTLPGVKVGIYSSTQRALEIVSTNSNALFVQSPAAYILTITDGTWVSQFTNTGRLDLAGDLLLNTIANATTDTDKFLVSDSGIIKYRTGAELLSDIGAQPSGSYVTSVNTLTGAVTLTTTNIAEGTNLYYTEARVNANTNVAANTAARHNAVTIGTANGLSLSTQVLSLALASGSTTGALSSTDWTTFNGKQAALSGTGFVKISGTTISYDNSTYLTTSAASSTYLPLTGGTLTGALTVGVTSGLNLILEKPTGAYLSFQNGATVRGSINGNNGADGLNLNYGASHTTALAIASTGAATFSSSVTATSFSNAGLQSGEVFNATKSNAGFYVGYLQNTSATGLGLYIQNGNDSNDAIRIGNAAGSANNIQLYGSGKAYFAGNVGIGTTSPAAILDINTAGSSVRFGDKVTVSNDINVYYRTTGISRSDIGGGGNFTWGVSGGSELMRITASGNVGIGTTSPSNKLDVLGTAASPNLTGTNAYARFYQSGGYANITIGALASGSYAGWIQSSDGVGTQVPLALQPSGGNVGIGTTSPTEKLDVIGGALAAGNGTIRTGITYSSLGLIGTFTNHDLGVITNGSERMRITSGGNVYIGTTSTTLGKFVVDATSQSYNIAAVGNDQTCARIRIKNTGSGGGDYAWIAGINNVGNDGLSLLDITNAATRLVVTSGGNVGINTTSPSYTLDVNGTARFGSAIVASLGTGLVYSSGGTLTSTNPSDQRLKNTIKALSYGLNEVLQLNPKTFYYNDDVNKERLKYGFIAQEVQGIMPELARKLNAETDYLGLETEGIYVTLVNAIKEQQKQIEELKAKIK